MNKRYEVKCSRCKAIFTGKDANVKFDQHKCKGMRDLMEMPSDLLLAVIEKKITEAEGWIQTDSRIAA